MNTIRIATAVFLGLFACHFAFGQDRGANAKLPIAAKSEDKDIHQLRPKMSTAELLVKSEQAIQDGLNFLVKTQNDDGSWGAHDPEMAKLADFGFRLRNAGNQDAVRTACTAICAEAFLNQPKLTQEQSAAFDKAVAELVRVRKFAFHNGESFNSWGYGYKLGFLVALYNAPEGKDKKKEIIKAAQSCVDGLLRYQQHNGGWHYYSSAMKNAGSMSFNTAFFAVCLHRAEKCGVKVRKGMIDDAVKIVDKQRSADGSMAYDSRFIQSSMAPLQNLGAGARTISCTVALHEIGLYKDQDLLRAMKIFDNGENYLESGRKLIQPHSAVHQISGYFFFFGYNYATEAAVVLGDRISQDRWDRLAWTILRTQEKDGRWWDTAAAGYGDKWGTGFAIQSLQRYVDVTKERQATKNKE